MDSSQQQISPNQAPIAQTKRWPGQTRRPGVTRAHGRPRRRVLLRHTDVEVALRGNRSSPGTRSPSYHPSDQGEGKKRTHKQFQRAKGFQERLNSLIARPICTTTGSYKVSQPLLVGVGTHPLDSGHLSLQHPTPWNCLGTLRRMLVDVLVLNRTKGLGSKERPEVHQQYDNVQFIH